MKLWIVSDLHTEAHAWRPDRFPAHDVIVIAGDISDSVDGAQKLLADFYYRTRKPIVFVPGNHDFFGADLLAFHGTGATWPVHILPAGESTIIAGVRFVGATLWTDWALGEKEYQAQAWAAKHMPEYQHVRRADGGLIWPFDVSDQHDLQRARIDAVLSQPFAGPTVVVTHHAPSAQSIDPGERRQESAGAQASDLEPMIWSRRPELWVHGHIHSAVDYWIGGTRVVCNPRGYQTPDWAEKTGWQEDMVIDL